MEFKNFLLQLQFLFFLGLYYSWYYILINYGYMLFSNVLCFIDMNSYKILCSNFFIVTIKTSLKLNVKWFNFIGNLFSALSIYKSRWLISFAYQKLNLIVIFVSMDIKILKLSSCVCTLIFFSKDLFFVRFYNILLLNKNVLTY